MLNIPNLLAHYQYPKYTGVADFFVVSEFPFSEVPILSQELQDRYYSFLTPQEIVESSDVFPLQFFTIQKFGTLISGVDYIKSIVLSPDRLRLALEYELRNKMIQLRGDSVSYPPQELIAAIIPTLSPYIAPLVFLITGECSLAYQENMKIIHEHIPTLPELTKQPFTKKYTEIEYFDMLEKTEQWMRGVVDFLESVDTAKRT